MPEDPNAVFIMVATGTGIAPYRAFWRRQFMEDVPNYKCAAAALTLNTIEYRLFRGDAADKLMQGLENDVTCRRAACALTLRLSSSAPSRDGGFHMRPCACRPAGKLPWCAALTASPPRHAGSRGCRGCSWAPPTATPSCTTTRSRPSRRSTPTSSAWTTRSRASRRTRAAVRV
jgi:hypothetical protein